MSQEFEPSAHHHSPTSTWHLLARRLHGIRRVSATIAAIVTVGAVVAILAFAGTQNGDMQRHHLPPAPTTTPRSDVANHQPAVLKRQDLPGLTRVFRAT